MGIFGDLKKAIESESETDISKMSFKRCDGFVGAAIQRFADVSLPTCPICGNNPHWLLHTAHKTVGTFPIVKKDAYYFLRCDSCGLTMHTVYREIGDRTAPFLLNPSPRDNTTMMTIDVVGDKAENFDLAGKELSIWEINQLAEKK